MKTPLALFLTDTHLADKNRHVVAEVFRQALEVCRQRGVSILIHGGDVFDSRKAQHEAVLLEFDQWLTALSDDGRHLHAIAGNHDKTDYRSDFSFLTVYKHHPALSLYEQGKIIELTKGKFVGFMPFYEDVVYEQNLALLTETAPANALLITHQTLKGAQLNGQPVDNGAILTRWEKALVGHLHDFHTCQAGKVVYTGSALQHNFGEKVAHKGFVILYDDWTLEHVQAQFPKHLVVRQADDLLASVAQAKALKQASPLDRVRLEVTSPLREFTQTGIAEDLLTFGIELKYAFEGDNHTNLTEFKALTTAKTLEERLFTFCELNKLEKEDAAELLALLDT